MIYTASEAPGPRDVLTELVPGERAYMETYVHSHYVRNLAAAFRWTDGDHFAQDLTQEAAIRLLLAYRRGLQPKWPGAYAQKIAWRVFLDTVRAASNKEHLTFEGILPECAGPPNPLRGDYDVTGGVEFLELLAEVREHYRGHPRVADIGLMVIQGYSSTEIAEILHTNRPAVSRDLARFRNATREYLRA